MRSAGNFHPEWGYLAPAPTFVRTVRIALVATAIGAVAGAAVVVSLVQRPGSNDDNAIAAHALLTRAPVISSPAAAPHTTAPAVATVTPPKPPAHQPQQFAATTAPSTNAPSTGAAAPAPATAPDVIASTGKPDKADSVSPPLPLPAPTDATVATNAPVGEAARVPAEADVAIAPDMAAEPRTPAKRSVAKRHRYEPYRRQETRGRWHDNGGFGPLFRLFSFRTGSPYSSN
jgi:hypothetical protein